MQPRINLLNKELTEEILAEAYQILAEIGVKMGSPDVMAMLQNAGCEVDSIKNVVRFSKEMIQDAIRTVPKEFWLYDAQGNSVVCYGGDQVHFDPGSSGVHILDAETGEHRPSTSADLKKLIQITESLPQYDAQSTAVVCHDVPEAIGDLYRLYLVLLYSEKPIITGAFSTKTTQIMFDMLAAVSGGGQQLTDKPRAIFDVCPSPPLNWSNFASQNLVDLARAGIPAQIVSMPLAGAAAPITLLGSVVQHAAECLSGITIHQLARPGSPIVWGGAPAIFDMRRGTTPMGAIETAMIDIAYAQIGKSLGLPTHTYLCASDSKQVDAQAGMESGMTALIGALGGINMISGAGMLDFLACQSPEKLVIDAEIIGMVKRFLKGIQRHTDTLAIEMFSDFDFQANFLKQKITRQLFSKEQYLPTDIIDRGSIRNWEENGKPDSFEKARQHVNELISSYSPPEFPEDNMKNLSEIVLSQALAAGMDQLPSSRPEYIYVNSR
jgi:trimethylamine--corrinoid protein Co-methyltransferase